MQLQKLLNDVAYDQKNPKKLFALAREYDILGQGAAAVSFYIKAADLEEEDKILQYRALIYAGKIFDRQGNRRYTVQGLYQHALSLIPTRPEAHYFLAQFYVDSDDWRHCIIHAKYGLMFKDGHQDIDVGYPGELGLYYLRALAQWRINNQEDSREMFFDMKHRMKLTEEYEKMVDNKLDEIGHPSGITYRKSDLSFYKFPFRGMEKIEKSHSRSMQEMFVLSVLDGKREGMFVDIGCGDPFHHNATAVLEQEFGWKGISVETSDINCYEFSRKRKSTVILSRAEDIDYNELFSKHCVEMNVDLLRISCDYASLHILKNIPFDSYRFSVVQFQHNHCWWMNEYRDVSRSIMKSLGYTLLVGNVSLRDGVAYEDWWVHPALVSPREAMKTKEDKNNVWDYFMRKR